MFAEIVLHRRVPSKFDSFTYEVPADLKIAQGQVVSVPFRNQKLPGIVRALHEAAPTYPTKVLESATELILGTRQMDLAVWMSKFYACGFSKVIDFFIPEKIWTPSKRVKKKAEAAAAEKIPQERVSEKIAPDEKPVEVSGTRNENLEKLVKELLVKKENILVLEKTPMDLREISEEISRQSDSDDQVLVLFPELFHLKKFSENLPVFHGELNETRKAQIWESIRNGAPGVIAGTRAALFLPFKKLSAIVVTFEHSESYKEKRTPNYDALSVAEKLAALWKIPLIVTSQTPRAETWHKMLENKFKKIEWIAPKAPTVKIIEMADERRHGNYGIFADETIEKIARTLSQNKQVLLFINQKGEASALLCPDCGNIFRCGTCSSSLTVHKELDLRCHRCKTSSPMPSTCDKCGNANLKPLGHGTEKLEKEIEKIFSRAKIIRLDSGNFASRGKKSVDEKLLEATDVIIATQSIDKPFTLPRLNLSVAVSPDPLLQFPHFRATERVFQLLTHIKNLTHPSGEFLIQTFLPGNPIFEYIKNDPIENFYEAELETRKSLSLPPFNSACP
ncbi:MAG: primosomal protein N' [Patescibacteria group bacterium]